MLEKKATSIHLRCQSNRGSFKFLTAMITLELCHPCIFILGDTIFG